MINMKKLYSVKNNDTSSSVKANLSASSNNLLDKISRRYSGISTKFLRKSPGRKGNNRDVVSGSYNMKGNQSDDLRPEIGLPILISKIDRTDLDDLKKMGPNSPSSLSTDDSENDVFVDATTCSLQNFSDIQFSFLPDDTSSPNSSFDATSYNLIFTQVPASSESPTRIDRVKSKSAQNLHRTELKVFLARAPSLLEVIEDYDESTYDLPKKRTKSPEMMQDTCDSLDAHQSDSSTGVSEAPIVPVAEKLSYSIQTLELPSSHEDTEDTFSSNSKSKVNKCQSLGREESLCQSNCSNNTHKTNDSHPSSFNDTDFDDFKSASLQSLNGKNIFLSIEELNEITRQINASEDFNQEIDYEYVEHRDNLKPSERRITLLRNKESNRFINFNDKKDKIAKKWTGVKHWINEERGKFKEVVHRHAAMQRPGATRADSVETNCTADDESSLPPTERATSAEMETSPDRQTSSLNDRTESEERQCTVDSSLPGSRKTSLNKSSIHNDSFEVCFVAVRLFFTYFIPILYK